MDYSVKTLPTLNPRVRVSGIDNDISEESIVDYLVCGNKNLFGGNSICLLKQCKPLRNHNKLKQVITEVDKLTYLKLIEAGKVLVGYDYCRVWDAVDIRRCFKCLGFNHTSHQCSQTNPTCPKCSGNHLLKECTADFLKCVHCDNLKKSNPEVNSNHASYDYDNCVVYKKQLENFKSRVLGTK